MSFEQQPTRHQSKPRSHQSKPEEAYWAGLLQGLAQLNINRENAERPVLGDKKNVPNEGGNINGGYLPLKKAEAGHIIVISDGERWAGGGGGERGPGAHRHTKAAQITKLTQAAGQAADNRALAQITADFVKVLQGSNSRTLTREGFAFLDALHKQLADPSVFIVPLRTSKTRPSPRSQQQQQPPRPAEDAGHERRSRINALRASLGKAEDNKSLAKVIAEFGTVIDRAAGRKLTKDGMMFLESVADQLGVVRV
jgi:casein kinase 1